MSQEFKGTQIRWQSVKASDPTFVVSEGIHFARDVVGSGMSELYGLSFASGLMHGDRAPHEAPRMARGYLAACGLMDDINAVHGTSRSPLIPPAEITAARRGIGEFLMDGQDGHVRLNSPRTVDVVSGWYVNRENKSVPDPLFRPKEIPRMFERLRDEMVASVSNGMGMEMTPWGGRSYVLLDPETGSDMIVTGYPREKWEGKYHFYVTVRLAEPQSAGAQRGRELVGMLGRCGIFPETVISERREGDLIRGYGDIGGFRRGRPNVPCRSYA
jgi:hypothetical protein